MNQITNLTPGKAEDLVLAGGGFVETVQRAIPVAQRVMAGNTSDLNVQTAVQVFSPAADGALAAGINRGYRQSGVMAPGTKQLLNSHPLRGDFGGVREWRLRKWIETAPSLAGHLAGARRYVSHKPIYAGSSINPRTAAITGVQVQPRGSSFAIATNRAVILDSAIAPQVLGDGVSKGAHILLNAAPGPMKPLLQLHA